MAHVAATDGSSILRLERWLGLNESPDGDTGLKTGEAAVMRNFRVTREGHLQLRPGYAPVCTLADGKPVRGMWNGYVDGTFHMLAACGGQLWDVDPAAGTAVSVGEIHDGETALFGFGGKVYVLTGKEYYYWNGTDAVTAVEGYIPTVVTACPPSGGGTLLERVNLLTGKRKVKFSPDGTATVFHLPESGIDEVLSVEGTDLTWTADLAAGTVTFAQAPAEGVSTVTITWRRGSGSREKITGMRFAETFNGASDARVFLYGDGTNECVYSDHDGQGVPSAEYFPDLNVMAVDSANTPITSMIRHYDRLLVCKSDSAYVTGYDTMQLTDGTVTAAWHTIPVNRQIGCAAPGQARLVENSPRTPFGQGVYTWALASGATRDERNAKRISDRVEQTLSEMDLTRCRTFDDERRQEYYLLCGEKAVIHNYGNDTWYVYDHFPARCMDCVNGGVYFGTEGGVIMHVSRAYRNDDREPIDAWWESGAMDFNREWKRKVSTMLWVSIKPESQACVNVTVQSNRRSDYPRRNVAAGLATLANASFAGWSFNTNRKPQVQRVKLKVKNCTFYKLIISSCSASATATVLSADLRMRYTGNVR